MFVWSFLCWRVLQLGPDEIFNVSWLHDLGNCPSASFAHSTATSGNEWDPLSFLPQVGSRIRIFHLLHSLWGILPTGPSGAGPKIHCLDLSSRITHLIGELRVGSSVQEASSHPPPSSASSSRVKTLHRRAEGLLFHHHKDTHQPPTPIGPLLQNEGCLHLPLLRPTGGGSPDLGKGGGAEIASPRHHASTARTARTGNFPSAHLLWSSKHGKRLLNHQPLQSLHFHIQSRQLSCPLVRIPASTTCLSS